MITPPSSGPPTVATAMTAPKRPAYLPRSRGLMMSAITIWLRAARPPAPMPWNTRIVMSVPVSCENPATADATTKMTRASCSSSLRLKRSASLPQMGVETVVASRVAVTTQVKADWSPSRSEMMSGSDVPTTVEASIDTNMPRRRPERAVSTSRCVMPLSESLAGAAASVVVRARVR